MLELSGPKIITFVVSIIIAAVAVVIHYANISIPHVHSGFIVLLIAYLILAAGNLLRGVRQGDAALVRPTYSCRGIAELFLRGLCRER